MATSHYQHPLKHYAEIYGVSYRTILRWSEKNFPLDDESATRLLASSSKAGAGPGLPTRHTPRPENALKGSLGLSASIQRLQTAEEAAHAEYEAVKAQGDAVKISHALKTWASIAEQLRKSEQTSPEVAEANKSTVPLDELQQALNDLFSKLRQDLDTLPNRLAKELISKDEIAIREILSNEINEIITSLFNLKYLHNDEQG